MSVSGSPIETTLNNELNMFLDLQAGSESTQTRNHCGASIQISTPTLGMTPKLDGQVAKTYGKGS